MLDEPERFSEWYIECEPTHPEDMAAIMRNTLPNGKEMSWEELVAEAKVQMDSIRAEHGDEYYQREILAQWVLRTHGRVLDGFRTENFQDHFDFDSTEGDVYWVFDRGEGKANTVCLFSQVMLSQPGVRVFGERYTMDIVDEGDWIEQCLDYSDSMGWPRPKMGVYDVRAPRYRRALWEHGIPAFGRNRVVNEGINLLNAGFRKGWINFHTRCTKLRNEMSDWKFKSSRTGESTGEPSDDGRDGADSLRYLYEYLIDHYGHHWRKMVKESDMQGLQRTSRETVFTFSWV